MELFILLPTTLKNTGAYMDIQAARRGVQAELPSAPNPRQLLLLPDAALANLPLETMPSLLHLFGDRGAECILRDHSLHMMAKRVRDSADVAADSAPLKVALQTLPRTSLLDKA
eukprot:s2135_g2.t1